jgi:mono/diheme cytochrome c family protein
LRRYLPTLILLFVLLLVGGLAIANFFGPPPTTRGAYVPTLSDDPQTAQLQALIFAVGLVVILLTTIGLGVFLAVSFVRLTRMLAAHPATTTTERTAAPKPAASGQGLDIPFSSDRSAAIFWIVVALLVLAFQVLRYLSNPLSVAPFGYLPGLGDLLSMPLFRLPGTHIEGLPSFIAGPGDEVTALHILLLVLGAAIVSVIAVGVGLARGFATLDNTVRSADKLPKVLPDRLIPAVESRIEALRQPRPRRAPRNPIDNFLVGLNVLLLLVIGGIVALYVVPSYSGVAAVDNAIEATRVAALATATPLEGGPPHGGETPAQLMQAAFAALPPGEAGAGQQVFQGTGGCVACHSLDAGVTLVGPSFDGLGQSAGTRRPEYSADAYLYESITNPNAYVVEGFQGGVMPQTFKDILSPQQLADVIAFVKSQ